MYARWTRQCAIVTARVRRGQDLGGGTGHVVRALVIAAKAS